MGIMRGFLDRKRHIGWFIGWATKGERRVLITELLVDDSPQDEYGESRSRRAMIRALPEIMRKER